MLNLAVISFPLAAVGNSLVSLLVGGGFFGAMIGFRIAKTIKKVNAFSQDHRHAKHKARDLA